LAHLAKRKYERSLPAEDRSQVAFRPCVDFTATNEVMKQQNNEVTKEAARHPKSYFTRAVLYFVASLLH
jgi:hypothetical protein